MVLAFIVVRYLSTHLSCIVLSKKYSNILAMIHNFNCVMKCILLDLRMSYLILEGLTKNFKELPFRAI